MLKLSRLLMGLFVLPLIASGAAPTTAAAACSPSGVGLKMLVITAQNNDTDLSWIQTALQIEGTPFDTFTAAPQPSSPGTDRISSMLYDAGTCRGNYRGVILTTGGVSYTPDNGVTWMSGLNTTEWAALRSYEATFGVRQVTWYTYPSPDYGFAAGVTATSAPLPTTLTAAGAAAFPYIQPGATLTITNSYTYLANQGDANATPMLVDSAGHPIALVEAYPDGRRNLALTFASSQYVPVIQLLSHGILQWLGNGLLYGERHAYLAPQVDDFFLGNNIWRLDPVTGACPTNLDDPSLPIYRITGADLAAVSRWQSAKQAQPLSAQLTLEIAFNAFGMTADASPPNPDTLVQQVQVDQAKYRWLSHTWDHTTLDNLNYADSLSELQQNDAAATSAPLSFSRYSATAMVTPSISGLSSPRFQQAAVDFGMKYLVGDTSRPYPYTAPVANTGNYSTIQPSIFIVPRHPVNLFFNVTTPAEWTGEYNCMYRSYWGRDLSYAEILDKTSDTVVGYMISGDLDPLMFHQSNLRAYDGTHSLLGDLFDAVLSKYGSVVNLPLVGLSEDAIGQRMQERMARDAAGVVATYQPGTSLAPPSLKISANAAARVPITGSSLACGSCRVETYGGAPITWVSVGAGQTITIPLG